MQNTASVPWVCATLQLGFGSVTSPEKWFHRTRELHKDALQTLRVVKAGPDGGHLMMENSGSLNFSQKGKARGRLKTEKDKEMDFSTKQRLPLNNEIHPCLLPTNYETFSTSHSMFRSRFSTLSPRQDLSVKGRAGNTALDPQG